MILVFLIFQVFFNLILKKFYLLRIKKTKNTSVEYTLSYKQLFLFKY